MARFPEARPPQPQQQPPPAAPALQQRAAAAMFLVLLSLLSITLADHFQRLPYVLGVSVAVAALGLGMAISSLVSAKRTGSRRPRGSVVTVVFSSVYVLFGVFALIGFLLFWPQFNQYASCLNAAGGSTAAQNACQTQFYNSLTASMGTANRG